MRIGKLLTISVMMTSISVDARAQPPASAACPFTAWTQFRGVALRRAADRSAYFYVAEHKAVDADGAPNAYHPQDVNGTACPATGRGLECPANAGYRSDSGHGNTDWWSSVLAADPQNPRVAYRQRSGQHRGYFVSKTSLQDTGLAGPRDPRSYVDATHVPYVVMPRPFHAMAGTGRMGDMGFALNLDTGDVTGFVFADVGPSDASLGEASIAFWQALGGNNPNPRNGAGVPRGRIAYVVFPYSGTAANLGWPIDPNLIIPRLTDRLDGLGGVEAMRRCAR